MRESINSGLLFDFDKLNNDVTTLTKESEKPDFWNDSSSALEIISKLNYSRNILEKFNSISTTYNDIDELLSLNDESILDDITSRIDSSFKLNNSSISL